MTAILREKKKGVNRHWKNYKDTDYLGSHNLEEGEEMLLTIAKFEGEEMVQSKEGSKTPRMVLYFEESVPKMILNITNSTIIAFLYGNHPEQWYGKQIQIYSANVKAFGKMQDALRIRDFVPKREVDMVAAAEKLNSAKSKTELKEVWESLSQSAKKIPELIALKDSLKEKLV